MFIYHNLTYFFEKPLKRHEANYKYFCEKNEINYLKKKYEKIYKKLQHRLSYTKD